LPANLFFGTGIPAAILIFDKARSANKDVLFIDASKEFESGKNQNILREKDIEHIVTTYKNYRNGEPLQQEKGEVLEDKYAYRATIEDIKENDFNLNIPRYVDTFEEEEEVDIKTVHDNIQSLKQQLSEVEAQMEKYLTELKLI
jgi:type I restriction enzyme M protein